MVDLEKVPSGRVSHILLELYKYIIEKPKSSVELLESLTITESKEPKILAGLVY